MPKENQCTGSYPVSGYTRGNGVEVDSYIRNCWKHSGGTSSNDTLFEYGQKNICKIDENIEKLSNQNEVSDSEVDNIYSNLFEVINVILKISDEVIKMYNNMPTELNQERIVQGNKLNKAKNNLEEMIYKAIGTSFNIQKVSNKNWSQVDTKDKNYYAKQKKYITIENIRKRISDDLTNLYRSVLSDSKNEFENALAEYKNYINIANAKLSEKTIDTIFNVGGTFYVTKQGTELWKYSKGEISDHDMSDKSQTIYGVHEYKSINDIKDCAIKSKLREKLDYESGLSKYNDLKGLVFNQTSTLSDKISKNSAFIKKIKELYKNNITKESNGNNNSYKFSNSLNLWSSLNKVDIIIKGKINDNLTVVVIDLYNYNNDGNLFNKMGYNVQRANIMKPFYVVVFVSIPISKIDK